MTLALPAKRQALNDDHAAFRDSVARFVTSEALPHMERWRHAGSLGRNVFAAAGEAGFLGTTVSEELGGGGIDDRGFTAILIEEAAAAGSTALAWAFAVQAGVAAAALTDPACSHWLPDLVSGTLIASVGAGEVTAADGQLTGRLVSIVGARDADVLMIDLGGADVAVVELAQQEVTVTRSAELAWQEAGVSDVHLDGARISARMARDLRPDIDLWGAVAATGAARYAIGLGLDYVRSRKVFGQSLAGFENTKYRMAELAASLTATTALVDSCVAAGPAMRNDEAAAARWSAGRTLDDVVDQCLQLHGGYGYMKEYPISTAFADARFLRLLTLRFSDPRATLAGELQL